MDVRTLWYDRLFRAERGPGCHIQAWRGDAQLARVTAPCSGDL